MQTEPSTTSNSTPTLKEQMEKRLDGLRAGKVGLDNDIRRLHADASATDGAIQEVEYWLSLLGDD